MAQIKPTVDLIACARREWMMRKRVYPRWVQEGRMLAQKAQHEVECMEGILLLLEKLKLLEEVTEEMKQMERDRQNQPVLKQQDLLEIL